MKSLFDYPFDNMPITNGSFWTVVIPIIFALVTTDYTLYSIWTCVFIWSIIIDNLFNDKQTN